MEKPVRSSLQNLSISYECALSIGNILNLPEMLHEVIHTMVHKTNAHRGIIWVKNGDEKLQPVASAGINIEDVLVQGEIRDLRDAFNQTLKRQQFVLRYKDDKDFLQYCSVLTGKEESVLIVPVTNVAILHLVYASREIADEPLANLLTSLSKKLRVAIEACMAHENVIKEIQVREKAENELTKKTDQLVSSQKELQGLYGESEQARKSLLSILEDVTQKEEALRESKERLKTTLDSIQTGIMIIDAETHIIVDANPAAIRMMGAPKEQVIGHICHKYICPAEEGKCPITDLGQKVDNSECILLTSNGKEIPILKTVTTMLLGGKECLLDTFIDITEKKKLEAQFRQAQKMEAIGVLAGGVAHDFNNLLTAILGNTQLALMKVIKDESLREGIQEIEKAGLRAASLTRQLLAFSRKQIIKPKILDINEVINETEKMLKRMIREDIEFLTALEPELWKVYTDPGQIDQVVMNLVVNAKDAMPRGGRLTIETANVELDETYFQSRDTESKPGPYVMLAVTDNGTGMDKETLSRIFDPFFTTKEVGSGTGLGLSTVYGIVKQNKGYVWVYSEPGKGTTFKIYFPRVAKDVVIAGKEQEEFAGEISGSETVLIVEDDDALRNITKKMLQKYGYNILEAENGEKALNIGETHEGPIHLLLTDVVMPVMSGSDLSEKLQSIRPETRVIYMSGYTDNAIVHHGILKQKINFIEKPFSPESLSKKVRQVLDGEN
jgi:PAS domain S-box-containing protein